ncbi:hypothetical protein Tco_1115486 [Tanacetum coccineum]
MFDIDYLTDSMNYIPVSLENQANIHAGTSEVTNNAGSLSTSNTSDDDEDAELIVVSTAVKNSAEKIRAFRRELDAIAQEFLGPVPENNTTSTPSVKAGSAPVNSGRSNPILNVDPDDSDMPELEIFHRPAQGIFDEASYDEDGMVHDFNSLPTEIEEEPKTISEALKDDSWIEAMQEELLQFKLQKVWILVDLPQGIKVIVIVHG